MTARAIRKPARTKKTSQRTVKKATPARPGGLSRRRRPPAASGLPLGEQVLRSRIQILENEVHKYRHLLTILRQASLGMTLDMSLDRLVESVTAIAADFFDADAISCLLWDENRKFLEYKAGYGFKNENLRGQRIPGQVLYEQARAGRYYWVTLDLEHSPFGDWELVREEKLVGVLSVTLHIGERLLGVLNIYSRNQARGFTLNEIENAHLFAQQASVAIYNLQLLTQLKEEVQIANTLLQVAEDIGSLGSLDEVLNRIVNIIIRVLNFEVCAVFLWDKERGFFLPAKAQGVPPHRNPFFHTLVLHRSDLAFTDAERRQRTVIDAANTPGRFPVEKLAGVLGHKDLYLAPLVVKNHMLGALVAGGFRGGQPIGIKGEMFFRGIAAQAAIAIDDANLFGELEQAFWETIQSLTAAIEAKDHYTHDHSEAVIRYGSAMARELALPEHEVDLVRKACLLHDVGKIGICDEILRKIAPLTPDERRIIERHPVIGEEILSSVRSLHEVSRIIRHHHEWYDGNGYPDRLQGQQIPLLSRILQIADSFDAMTSDRPYRKALSRSEAVEQLRQCAGKQFDPELVEVFIRLLDKMERQHPDLRDQASWS